MEEIKSVRVRTSESNDIKVTIYKSGNKRKVSGYSSVNTLGDSEYGGSRYRDLSDDEIIQDFLSVVSKRENKSLDFYKIVQNPWMENPPMWRSYGTDPYYLNNGTKVFINWLNDDDINAGGKEWSDESGNELDIKRGLTSSTKGLITKTVTIRPPSGSGDNALIVKDSNISDLFETGQKFIGNTVDLSIITQVISYWKNKVPNYELSLCSPNNEFCNTIPYKSPVKENSPDDPEPIPTEESTQNEKKIKLNVVLPTELSLRVKDDLNGLKVYVGDIPPLVVDGFVFQDDFKNLDELDPEFTESGFVGEEETNAVADEPDPQQLEEEQEVGTPTSPVSGAPLSNSKLLISSKSGRYYVLSTNNGVAGHRLKNVITDLENYLNSNGFSGTKLASNGIMRDLESSAVPSNPARAKGSLHGAGLAIDLKFTIPGKSWSGIGDNGNLSKDSKLNKAIYNWVKSQGDITWGGQWGKSKPESGMVQGWGITEYHHFEIKSSKIVEYWKPFSDELSSIGFDYKKLNTTTNLQSLYLKLLGKGGGLA